MLVSKETGTFGGFWCDGNFVAEAFRSFSPSMFSPFCLHIMVEIFPVCVLPVRCDLKEHICSCHSLKSLCLSCFECFSSKNDAPK